MNETFLKIKKGVDLPIAGKVCNEEIYDKTNPEITAIYPDDFVGLKLKPNVREGEHVALGAPILYDKDDSRIKVVAPISGTIKAIVRGERRKIIRVEIVRDGIPESANINVPDVLMRDTARKYLLENGLWALMRQRPYDIVPKPDVVVRDIFVTAFDSSPLAPDWAKIYAFEIPALETGIKILNALTDGNVYVSRRPGTLPDLEGATMVDVEGPHPAGNAGTIINNIAPVNKGETVLTLTLKTLVRIGKTVLIREPQWMTIVAVTGSEVKEPRLVRTSVGAPISSLIENNLKDSGRHVRLISGNPLTGVRVDEDDFIRYPYNQLTCIAEGDDADEFMGWASVSPSKMSLGRSFPGHWLRRLFSPDARLNGGRRAMIMSGEYEQLMPMDIMPEYLIKAILSRDIDRMEQLGIYEVAPEDFALAEYADTSKLELQKIVREGLDFMRKETE